MVGISWGPEMRGRGGNGWVVACCLLQLDRRNKEGLESRAKDQDLIVFPLSSIIIPQKLLLCLSVSPNSLVNGVFRSEMLGLAHIAHSCAHGLSYLTKQRQAPLTTTASSMYELLVVWMTTKGRPPACISLHPSHFLADSSPL